MPFNLPARSLWLCFPFAMLGLLGTYTNLAPDAAIVATYPVWMRWMARCVSLVVYGVLLVPVVRGRLPFRSRTLVGVSGVLLLVGVVLTLGFAANPVVFTIAQVLVGLGNPMLLVAWGSYLATLSGPLQRNAIVLAALADALLILVFSLASTPIASVLYLVIIAGSFVPLLAGSNRHPGTNLDPSSEPDRNLGSPTQSLVRAVPWELILLMACYALLYRVLQNFDYRIAVVTPVVRAIATFTMAATLGLYLHKNRPDASRRVTLFLFCLAATALVLIPFSDGTAEAIASAIASSCWPLFYYLLWILLLDLGTKNRQGPAGTFVIGWFILNVELVLAAPVAWLLAQQVSRGALSMTALVLVLVYTLLVASLLVKRKDTTKASSSETARTGIEELCRAAGIRYGLTPREGDVLQLLARGRSVPFIADELHISQSTTKGHVRHIYEKMDVANKQELLTKVEGQ